MKLRYLFPCPNCQAKVPLAATQAGQNVRCESCQVEFEAPQLQRIKDCPLADDSQRISQNPVDTHIGRVTIVAGLILMLFGTIAGGALYLYANSMVFELKIDEDMELISQKVAEMEITEVYREWYYVEGGGDLGEWFEVPPMRLRAQGLILRNVAFGLFGIGALGLGTFLLGLFYSKKQQR